jgi:hypothetical protein
VQGQPLCAPGEQRNCLAHQLSGKNRLFKKRIFIFLFAVVEAFEVRSFEKSLWIGGGGNCKQQGAAAAAAAARRSSSSSSKEEEEEEEEQQQQQQQAPLSAATSSAGAYMHQFQYI